MMTQGVSPGEIPKASVRGAQGQVTPLPQEALCILSLTGRLAASWDTADLSSTGQLL